MHLHLVSVLCPVLVLLVLRFAGASVISRTLHNRSLRQNGATHTVPINSTSTTASSHRDPFSPNLLSQFFPNDMINARIDSALTRDHLLTLVGVITYTGNRRHPNITDEADITPNTLTSAFIMQAKTSNSSISPMWTKRTCPCERDARFVVTADKEGNNIWIAGSTSGIPVSNRSTTGPGMALIHYFVNGTQSSLRQHGAIGETYLWADYVPEYNGTHSHVALIGKANSQRFDGMNGGLFLHITNSTGDIVSEGKLTKGDRVLDEFYWHALRDGNYLFTVGKQVQQSEEEEWRQQRTPLIKKYDLVTRKLLASAELPEALQSLVVLCKSGDQLIATYVSRLSNQEKIIIKRFNSQMDATESSETNIIRDRFVAKSIKSSVQACTSFADQPMLLVNTAQVLNQTEIVFNSTRNLTNPRSALVVVEDGKLSAILQSERKVEWTAAGMVNEMPWMVYGKSESSPLLSLVNLSLQVSPTPALPKKRGTDPTQAIGCIGVKTRLIGRAVSDVIREDGRMRIQIHPLLLQRTQEVLCHGQGEDLVCTTADHVVWADGRYMFMTDLCARKGGCRTDRQRVLNFKARCGILLPPSKNGVQVSMHSGSHEDGATGVVSAECALHRTLLGRIRWWLQTL